MTAQPARREGPTTGRGRRLPLLAAAVVAIGLLAAAAVLLTRGGAPASKPSGVVLQNRPVAVEGADLARLPDGGPDPAVGRPMPVIRGASFDGTPVTIAPDGHAKLVVFVAHWCPHCEREVPELVSWIHAGGPPRGVEIYAVSTATRAGAPDYPPSEWLKREGWPAPVLADTADGRAAEAAGLTAYPFFVFVDTRGIVAQRVTGERPIADLEERVHALRASP